MYLLCGHLDRDNLSKDDQQQFFLNQLFVFLKFLNQLIKCNTTINL